MAESEAKRQQDAFNRLKAAADTLGHSIGEYVDSLGPDRRSHPRSRAALDSRTLAFRDAVETISSQASLLVEAAGDYLYAVVRLLTEPALTVAPYGAARGVLEASVQVLWLLESDIEPDERLGRSLSLRLAGIRDQATLLRSGGDSEGVLTLAARARELANIARSRGIAVKLKKNGSIDTIGPPVPSTVNLASKLPEGQIYWRLLSSVTHSQLTLVMTSSFRRAGSNLLEKHISADAAAVLMTRSARWFSRAAWAYLDYSGWINTELVGILEAAFDDMLLGEKERFWREQASVDGYIPDR